MYLRVPFLSSQGVVTNPIAKTCYKKGLVRRGLNKLSGDCWPLMDYFVSLLRVNANIKCTDSTKRKFVCYIVLSIMWTLIVVVVLFVRRMD